MTASPQRSLLSGHGPQRPALPPLLLLAGSLVLAAVLLTGLSLVRPGEPSAKV